MGSREPPRRSSSRSHAEERSLQAEVAAESLLQYISNQSVRGQSRLYAEHDALMRREKHIWKYNRNSDKNRNPASVCYNEGAVELTTSNKKEEKLDKDRTYINANHLHSPDGDFILAQAPMSNTLIDWFRMIWQLKIAIVVCLTDPENPACCEPYFKLRENQTLKVKNRFVVRTISVREEDGGITNYHLKLTNKLSSEKNRTLYVIAMPTSLHKPVNPRKQLSLVAEVWATETATSSLVDGTEVPPILVHGCYGVSRTAAFVATCMMCKSLQTRGEMSPLEVWARLNHARHNAAKERVHFLSSIECALLFAVDIGLLSANNPQLIEVNKMFRQSYDEELKKERPVSASREQ
ncbi:Protein-tyrosine phosphatase [Ancylostoma caninum]|uniref:Protein-tyrosine phosphatase n=1 Tax=Ancylostoma caninum TaxID=29170 RepID=A0A368H195_ANCCA|nr:Protein-tyrosine phosphatase [Ancylostoma caninum]